MSRWFRDLDAERRIAAAEGQAADLRATVQQLLQQNHDLVQQIAAMKRDGFDAPAPVKFEQQEPRFPAKVTEAILQRASPRSREYAHLETVAADMLAKGDDPEAIAQAILIGEDPDDLV
jgi:hypothetical protein